ncbi:hypothetical protein CMV_021953 [Castanea mollissima]|uniref:Uncharacterized protein n=1 Tax=Castanea mollissima TaxID=60419 RepID=A0A8J4QSE2_9ROSI|nr:hypothetical protein CMV_021953 [Castanea mollissima]
MEVGIYTIIGLIQGQSLEDIGNSEDFKRIQELGIQRNQMTLDLASKILKLLGTTKPELLIAGEALDAVKQLSETKNPSQVLDKLDPEIKKKIAEQLETFGVR